MPECLTISVNEKRSRVLTGSDMDRCSEIICNSGILSPDGVEFHVTEGDGREVLCILKQANFTQELVEKLLNVFREADVISVDEDHCQARTKEDLVEDYKITSY